MSGAYEKALAAYRKMRAKPTFDERMFDLHHRDKFVEHFDITSAELVEIILGVNRAETAASLRVVDQWREAILFHGVLTLAEKVAALAIGHFVNHAHHHCWPSQEAIAKRLGYSRGPALGKALKRSFEVGALTPMTVKHLPDDLRTVAVDKSRRSLRGQAYRLNAVDSWEAEAAQYAASQNSQMFHHGTVQGSTTTYLNSQGNSQVASPQDVSHQYVASSATLRAASTYQNGHR